MKISKQQLLQIIKEEIKNVYKEGSKESAKAQTKLLKYLEKDGWKIDVKHHVISAKPPAKLDPQKQIVVSMHSAHGKGAGDTFADYRRVGKLYGVNKDVMMKAVDDDSPISGGLKENSSFITDGSNIDKFENMLDYLEQQLFDEKRTFEEKIQKISNIQRMLSLGDVFSAAYEYEKYFGETLTSDEKSTLNSIYKEFG